MRSKLDSPRGPLAAPGSGTIVHVMACKIVPAREWLPADQVLLVLNATKATTPTQ